MSISSDTRAEEAIKLQLEGRLSALKSRLSRLRGDIRQLHSGDSAEQAQERENDEVLDVIGNETQQSIRLIQAALERIENGTYGLCGACAEPIGEARLKAMPEAIYCLGCASTIAP
jgi:RNA polymerase-binding transcription factor DksA